METFQLGVIGQNLIDLSQTINPENFFKMCPQRFTYTANSLMHAP